MRLYFVYFVWLFYFLNYYFVFLAGAVQFTDFFKLFFIFWVKQSAMANKTIKVPADGLLDKTPETKNAFSAKFRIFI